MIKFSIITVTYNAGQLFEKTARNVMEQTYPEVEHIIIDGASTDGTAQKALDYKQANEEDIDCLHEVVVISEPDRGLYDAMNKGLKKATGDYVLFLNAGDVLPTKDTLENIEATVGEGETLPAVLYGETDIVDEDGNFIRHRRLTAPKKLTWRSFMRGMLVCHQAFYARTDIARQTSYNLEYRYSADVDWCIRIMKKAHQERLPMRNVGFVVVNFLAGGISKKNHRNSLKERFAVMRKHYGLLPTAFMHAFFILRALVKK